MTSPDSLADGPKEPASMDHPVHILHLEDDAADAELVQAVLESAGLACRITRVQSRDEFGEALRRGGFDVILADFRLPMFDGVSALRMTQELGLDIPFIFLSGTMGEDAAIEGLTRGATDYVLKQKLSRLVPAVTRALDEAENQRQRRQAEEALREAERQLRTLIDNLPTCIARFDADCRYLFVSPAAVRTFGLPPEHFLGKTLRELGAPGEDAQNQVLESAIKRAFAEGVANALETHWVTRAGIRCYDVRYVPEWGDDGKVASVLGIAHDITARKQAEEELARVNRALRILSESNQAMIRVTDEAALLAEVCRITVEGGGYRMAWVGFAEQDEARTIRPVAHAGFEANYIAAARLTWADDCDRGRGPGGVAIREGQPCMCSDIARDPAFAPWRDEALRRGYQSVIALPLAGEGRTFGVLGIYAGEPGAFDAEEIEILTELASDLAFGISAVRTRAKRDQAEVALRESEERFHALFEQSPMPYQSLDADGRFLEANAAWLGTLGYARAEVIGQRFGDFLVPEQVDFYQKWFITFKQVGEARNVEFRLRRKDGSIILASFDGKIGHYPDGSFRQSHCVFRDITERRRAEEELARYRDHLEELVEQRTREMEAAREQARRADRLASIGTFAAGIAHEINNPLGMMLLGTDAALACVDQPEALTRLLRQNKGDIERCARIVRGVLDFAQQQPTQKRPLDMNEVVRHGVDFTREYSARRGVAVEARLATALPLVSGNAVELGQVVVNLVHNAVQACGPGGHVAVHTQEAGNRVRLVVRDDGCGMTEEQIRRVFDPFYTTRLEEGGTGLGLSIVHGIVASHEGTIQVASQEGRGTTFTIEFERHAEARPGPGRAAGH